MEVTVDGPFPTYEAVEKLEEILDRPKWNRPIGPSERTRWALLAPDGFKEVIEDVFVDVVRDLGRLPFMRPSDRPMVTAKTLLISKASLWYVAGNLSNFSAGAFAHDIIEGAKQQAVVRSAPPASPVEQIETDSRLTAYGGFVFPPVWIGNAPKPTFAERLRAFPMFPAKAYEGTYKGRLFIADRDGFLGIVENDRLKATALLNEIMAVRLVGGKTTYALRENEVSEISIDPQEKQITSKGVTSLSPRSSLIEEWFRGFRPRTSREVISNENLEKWLHNAEQVTQDISFSETLRFLLEAYTHFQNSDYLETFVLSWLIIEKDIYSHWDRYLETKSVLGPRRRKLENPGAWTIDIVIEELSLAGEIPLDAYQKLMSMKTVRNNIIHKGERVSEKQANELLELALKTVTDQIVQLGARFGPSTSSSSLG